MNRVIITGIGIVSSLGIGVEEQLYHLRNGISGITKARFFESIYSDKLYFGEVKKNNEELVELANFRTPKGISRTTFLAMIAFREAIEQAQLPTDEISSFDTAFLSASTVGGMCHTDELYNDANFNGETSEFVKTYSGADHTQKIAEHFQMNGITDTINTACSSSANAILLGAKLIRNGRAKRVIVGGVDSLAKYTVNGFNALRILSENPCKPFDIDRDGLNLGEGAGYIVMEADSVCGEKQQLAELIGYGNSNDAFHPSATSDNAVGPLTAMRLSLEKAQINPNEIDYINAHGTGTENNDRTELFALKELFDTVPPFNSTKSYTGHTLGAAGVLEAIYSIFSLQHNEIYPSLNCSSPIENTPPISRYESKSIRTVLTNSFGFGGNCTSLVFRKV